ncbi:MAG TPA: hypothetical protein VE821_01590, partial [Pyrinomonadaceae bacterium]|nr:hypothetical protein [Pyrinomonadaceae bacterium]
RGSGFGHGLGLCQMGAHVQARSGTDYRQILAYYFPGTSLAQLANAPAQWHDDLLWRAHDVTTKSHEAIRSSSATKKLNLFRVSSCDFVVKNSPASINHARTASAARLTLASEHFRVSYTAQAERRDVEDVLRTLEAARADMQQRLTAASLDLPALPVLEIVAHETTGDFVGATGQPAWAAAATRGRRIELQPLATLRKRGVLTTTLRHEYAHAVIDALSKGRAPRWLAEGLAVYAAGEGVMLARVAAPKQRLSTDELEQQLAQPASAAEMRVLYAAAYREVVALIRKEGEANIWRRVAHS